MGLLALSVLGQIVDEEGEFEQVRAFGSQCWVLLDQAFDKFLGLWGNIDCVIDLIFIYLSQRDLH
jgi:hypothetical protein